MMMCTRILAMVLAVSWCVAAPRPNIVLILADDFGWADTSFTGSKYYKTPNLERLAKQGVYFNNAYSASPLCSPTRSSIMTGQSPARTGLTSPACHLAKIILEPTVSDSSKPTDRQTGCTSITRLSTDHFTLAEALKEGGYTTGHFGKWHLGSEPYSPLEHGFDVDVPHWPGPGPAGSFVAPWKFPDFKEKYPEEHIEDRMGDEAVAFMEKNRTRPFYLNYWQFSVHAPFNAKAELIEKYKQSMDPNDPQQSPTYAAMVQSLDDNVGKILDALERLEIAENTIVIFYSDNGGNMYDHVDGGTATSNKPLRGGKATIYEGGIRIPAIIKWPGVTKAGVVNQSLVQSEDLYPTILEMAGLPVRKEQALDAISMVPALKTGQGARDAVYCYFPHAPTVPDWAPPSIAIRKGDWKLIRFFYENRDGGHRYELYNLADDIGEKSNLAATQPERVRNLDALIEKFLSDTESVTPKVNSKYDPKMLDSQRGWKVWGDARLNLSKQMYHLRCFSNTAGIFCEKRLGLKSGKYKLAIRIRSWADGPAKICWSKNTDDFADANSIGFDFPADGLWREREIIFELNDAADHLLISPASGMGSVMLAWIRLYDATGKLLEEWHPEKMTAAEKPVGGWRGLNDNQALLQAQKGILNVKVTGADPKLISNPLKFSAGEYVFALRIKSNAGGDGLLFTRPAHKGYERGSGISFSIEHNDQWHEIKVPFKCDHEIREIRLDPATQPGMVQIDWMRLTKPNDKILREWTF